MWLLWSRALEGMQPTFKHVPPRLPRFSTHVTCGTRVRSAGAGAEEERGLVRRAYFEAELGSFDCSNVAAGPSADNDDILQAEHSYAVHACEAGGGWGAPACCAAEENARARARADGAGCKRSSASIRKSGCCDSQVMVEHYFLKVESKLWLR